MKNTKQSFKSLFAKVEKQQAARIKAAGKHVCKRQPAGMVRRVTSGNGKILKRPVVISRFYECAICGKDMK